jgi:heat shock protein HslJ
MITFKGGGASGSGLCSTFSITTITVDTAATPPRLMFGSLSSTTSGCLDQDWQRVDTAFLDALKLAQSIELIGGRLALEGPGGTVIFERVPRAS